MKLYELTAQYRGLAELSDIPDDALRDTLEGLEGEIQIKAENLLMVVSNMNADATAIDTEIKRLQARKKAITNRQNSLRDYLKHNMQQSGISKIQCPLFSITLAKGRPMAVIEQEDLLPKKFIKTTRSPIKADILRALKAGEQVPGAVLGELAQSLWIK